MYMLMQDGIRILEQENMRFWFVHFVMFPAQALYVFRKSSRENTF